MLPSPGTDHVGSKKKETIRKVGLEIQTSRRPHKVSRVSGFMLWLHSLLALSEVIYE